MVKTEQCKERRIQRPDNLIGESQMLGLIICKQPGEAYEDYTGPTTDSRTPPKIFISEEIDGVKIASLRVGLSFLSTEARMHRCRPTHLSLFSTYYPSPPIQLHPSKRSIISVPKPLVFLSAKVSSSKPLVLPNQHKTRKQQRILCSLIAWFFCCFGCKSWAPEIIGR